MTLNKIFLPDDAEAELLKMQDELHGLYSKALWSDAEKLLRTMISEYPGELKLVSELIYVQFQLVRRSPGDTKRARDAISVGEKLLGSVSDVSLRGEINRNLCFIASITGDTERAKKYYDRLPTIEDAREMYAAYISDGDDLKEQLQRNVETYITCAATAAKQLGYREEGERASMLLEKSLSLYELLYEDGDCGPYYSDMAVLSLDIAAIKAKNGDSQGALDYLEKAVGYAKSYNSKPQENLHTSVLVDRLEHRPDYQSTVNVSDVIADTLKTSPTFAPLRAEARFKALFPKK